MTHGFCQIIPPDNGSFNLRTWGRSSSLCSSSSPLAICVFDADARHQHAPSLLRLLLRSLSRCPHTRGSCWVCTQAPAGLNPARVSKWTLVTLAQTVNVCEGVRAQCRVVVCPPLVISDLCLLCAFSFLRFETHICVWKTRGRIEDRCDKQHWGGIGIFWSFALSDVSDV